MLYAPGTVFAGEGGIPHICAEFGWSRGRYGRYFINDTGPDMAGCAAPPYQQFKPLVESRIRQRSEPPDRMANTMEDNMITVKKIYVVIFAIAVLTGCSKKDPGSQPEQGGMTEDQEKAAQNEGEQKKTEAVKATADKTAEEPAVEEKKEDEPKVTARVLIKTSEGDMEAELYGELVPKTVANFLSYVDKDFYKDLTFHRVIPGFMIQGGGHDVGLNKKETDPPIPLEIVPSLKHVPGALSMARTNNPNSATSQFFICHGTPSQLDGRYAVFGKVTKGLDVVDKIATKPTKAEGMHQNVPKEPVMILSISRI